MIYFISGTPGAGKTLFTIHQLSKEKVRPIYYYKIELTEAGKAALPNWIGLDAEGVKDWQSLPDGSIILVDEAHTIMGQRSAKDKVPKWIEDLAEHRHRGMDFYIVDQHPKDLDVFVRRRVYQHWHYFNVFGMNASTKHAWQGYEDDQPNDYHAKQRAETSRHSFPSEVFAWYKSATIHTKKKRIPWQLFAIPSMFFAVGGILYSAYTFFLVPDLEVASVVSDPVSVQSAEPVSGVAVPTVAPVGASVAVDSPRKRVIYKDFRNAAIPDYVFTSTDLYLTGQYDVFGSKGSEYVLVLADGSSMEVDNGFFEAIGGKIAPIDKKCMHRVSFVEFDLFSKCMPKKEVQPESVDDLPASQPSQVQPDASPKPFSPFPDAGQSALSS